MSFTFHIIYTPDTVRHLSFFVWSLLKWSDCSFRLVANGCLAEEVQHLQQLCQQSSRLTFLTFPTHKMMPHAHVLNYLQAQNRDDYFCFMDSDILATGDFLSQVTPNLAQHSGLFSGTPVWQKAEDQVLPEGLPGIKGHHCRTAEGLCLGSSYFAIYDNAVLTRLVQSTGVGFDRCSWQDTPPQYRQKLAEMGVQGKRYDTGKLINLLLLARDERLVFVDSPHLCHLGGLSVLPSKIEYRLRHPKGRMEKLAARLPRGRLRQKLVRYGLLRRSKRRNKGVSQAAMEASITQDLSRVTASHYFRQLLQALSEEQSLPAMPKMSDPETQARVEAATAEIVALHQEISLRSQPPSPGALSQGRGPEQKRIDFPIQQEIKGQG